MVTVCPLFHSLLQGSNEQQQQQQRRRPDTEQMATIRSRKCSGTKSTKGTDGRLRGGVKDKGGRAQKGAEVKECRGEMAICALKEDLSEDLNSFMGQAEKDCNAMGARGCSLCMLRWW